MTIDQWSPGKRLAWLSVIAGCLVFWALVIWGLIAWLA